MKAEVQQAITTKASTIMNNYLKSVEGKNQEISRSILLGLLVLFVLSYVYFNNASVYAIILLLGVTVLLQIVQIAMQIICAIEIKINPVSRNIFEKLGILANTDNINNVLDLLRDNNPSLIQELIKIKNDLDKYDNTKGQKDLFNKLNKTIKPKSPSKGGAYKTLTNIRTRINLTKPYTKQKTNMSDEQKRVFSFMVNEFLIAYFTIREHLESVDNESVEDRFDFMLNTVLKIKIPVLTQNKSKSKSKPKSKSKSKSRRTRSRSN
jgi:hypothetical protein